MTGTGAGLCRVSSKTRKEEREKLYARILADLRPLEKKYSTAQLRWALNKWAKTEAARSSLLRRKRALEQQLAALGR